MQNANIYGNVWKNILTNSRNIIVKTEINLNFALILLIYQKLIIKMYS